MDTNAGTHLATTEDSERSVGALESEITTLAAHLTAATYRFLTLIGDFDRRGAWAGFGIRSCAHWLNWKCGIGLVAAREKLRVAHALEQLPLISAAMQRGALSYAKVRAVTRVATPENEALLLDIAQHSTASHVETIVRHYRRTQRLMELEHDNARHEARSLRYYWDEDGCLVIEGRLPPEQGAIVVRALETADRALREASEASREPKQPSPGTTCAAADVFAAATSAANAEDHANETDVLAHCDADDGDDSAEAHLTRPDHAQTRFEQDVSVKALAYDGLSWANRQADALALMAETLLARGPQSVRSADKHLIHVHVDLAVLHAPKRDGESAIENGPTLPPEAVRRLCCDGGLVTWLEDDSRRTLDVGRKTRAIPPALRRALDKRDRGCCFPGCTNHRFVDAHHIEHWADGGETKLQNVTLLCRTHHRLVHEGGFRVARDHGKLRFFDSYGRELPAVPPSIHVPRPGAQHLSEEHAAFGLTIDDETAICDWRGEHPDYGYIVKLLCLRDEPMDKQALS